MTDYHQFSKEQLIEELEQLQADQSVQNDVDKMHYLRHDLEVHQIELEMQNRELREKQQELEAALDKYADLYDFAPIGYLTLNKYSVILEINLTATKQLDQNRSQLLGIPFTTLLDKSNKSDFRRILQQVSETGDERSMNLELKRKNNTDINVHLQMTTALDHGDTVIRVALLDISQQRKAEEMARHHMEEASRLQRLQTANELATLLAHEINQPLTAMSTYAAAGEKLLQKDPLDKEKLVEVQRQISLQSMRAGEIIRWLRAFVKRGVIDTGPLDLNSVVKSAYTLINPKAARNGIQIDLNLYDEMPPVQGAHLQIEQVLLNLLDNAIEAIRDTGMTGGHISVETRLEKDFVHVSVRDNGPGIDAEEAKKVFDTLYSTKKNGLGVGLSISHSLIQIHHGRLWVEPSQPGGIFHFMLPIASK